MKKNLQFLILFIALFLTGTPLFAQEKNVSGTVLSDEGKPLEGVTVSVRGTSRKTQTNSVGYYTILARTGQDVVFTYVGFGSQTISAGANTTVNLKMQPEEKQLGEVIVTALGIIKPTRSTGYATNNVKGEDIANTQRDNILTSLAGRIPGVTITQTTGMPGSSTSIILRGINSISGSNQPLFVVDGLPVDNQTLHGNNFVTKLENRNVDFTNRISDINPEDIESMTILKGPEAAALYGIDAANGAIIITTKKGKAGQGSISYSFNYGIEKIGRLPEIPHVYSRGANNVATNVFSYFGPKYPEGTQFYDNLEGFFRTGKVAKHNLSFDGGSDKFTYRLSSGFSRTEGVIPTTKYDRINVNLNTTAQIVSKLKSEASFQYVYSYNDKVSKGANSFYLGMLSWPADNDMKDYLNPNGTRKRVTAGSEIENPNFDVTKNVLNDRSNRFITNLGLIYDPLKWLTLTGRVGVDVNSATSFFLYHPESNRTSLGGSIDQGNYTNRNITIQYLATGRQSFFNNKLKSTLRIGSTIYDYNFYINSVKGERFIDPNFKSLNNTDPTSQRQFYNSSRKRLLGVYGNLDLNYSNFLYLTLTGRNDFSSTLPKGNNSFFYPSASLAFIFTELLKNVNIGPLNFGKLRLSAAQVGKDALAYSLNSGLESQGTTGGAYSYGFTAPNPVLRPEKITSKEIGLELQFFKNRLAFDGSYYRSKGVDQIINGLRISYGTGFILKNVNGGEIENWGTELLLRGTPIQKTNFNWDISINYTKTGSRVNKIGEGTPEYYNSDTWLFGNVRNGSRVGGPLTTFTASQSYETNAKGDILISPTTGLPLQVNNSSWPVVGDRNPDFMIGLINKFNYKGLGFSFLWDIRKGGDVFNATGEYLYLRGLTTRSIEERESFVVFPGLLKDGLENSANPTKNNIAIYP
ncbi:MAG: SusC/RagA family TonB-linked outer membrane protein, partial [Chitinophagaceae bacterium]|nr:SusC/RagA family TonB-linked outer membrane protein [Chitinophagaceae bacterium]